MNPALSLSIAAMRLFMTQGGYASPAIPQPALEAQQPPGLLLLDPQAENLKIKEMKL